jgi:hypothetical protein
MQETAPTRFVRDTLKAAAADDLRPSSHSWPAGSGPSAPTAPAGGRACRQRHAPHDRPPHPRPACPCMRGQTSARWLRPAASARAQSHHVSRLSHKSALTNVQLATLLPSLLKHRLIFCLHHTCAMQQHVTSVRAISCVVAPPRRLRRALRGAPATAAAPPLRAAPGAAPPQTRRLRPAPQRRWLSCAGPGAAAAGSRGGTAEGGTTLLSNAQVAGGPLPSRASG